MSASASRTAAPPSADIRQELPTAVTAVDRLARVILYAEIGLTLFCLLLFSNALIGPLFAPQTINISLAESDSAILRLIWPPVYAVVLLLISVRVIRLMRILPALFMIGLLVGLCFASTYWSIAPDITSRRAIAVTMTSLFGLYLASRYRGAQLVQIIGLAFAILTAGSYFVCICVPHLGIHNDINAGAWKGLWYEKNQMAAMMVLGFIATCASAYIPGTPQILDRVGGNDLPAGPAIALEDLAARLSGQRRGHTCAYSSATRRHFERHLCLAGRHGCPDRQRNLLHSARLRVQDARQGPDADRPY